MAATNLVAARFPTWVIGRRLRILQRRLEAGDSGSAHGELPVGGGVLLRKVSRHPAAFGDRETLTAGPFPDLRRLARAAAARAAGGSPSAARGPAAGPPTGAHIGRERVAELGG